MKKFIFMLVAMLTFVTGSIYSQKQTNYAGSSKFTDNWSVTLQGGVVTPFNDFFKNGSTTPVIVLGADKYLNPWFGLGVEGRTSIGVGDSYNYPTAFDMVNVNGYVKLNIINMFNFTGERHMFEPVVYTGLGWNHINSSCAGECDHMTYRAGVELNFNLGKEKAWGIVVNPAVVWGGVYDGRLAKSNGNFEVTAGVVYHFKNSNGKRSFSKAKLYDQDEIDALNATINELRAHGPVVVEKVVEKVVTNAVAYNAGVYTVNFAYNSAAITDNAKLVLDTIDKDCTVVIDGYASQEPRSKKEYNMYLSLKRAEAVKAYLENRGVTVKAVNANGMDDNYGRVAVVKVQ